MYNEILLLLCEATNEEIIKTAAKDFDFDIPTEYRRIRRRALFNPELKRIFEAAIDRELNAILDTKEKLAARDHVVKEVLAIDWGRLNPFSRENPEVSFEDYRSIGGEEGRLLAQIKQLLRNPETAEAVKEQLQRIVGRQGQSWLGSTWQGMGRAVDEARQIPGEVQQWGTQQWERGKSFLERKVDELANYYSANRETLELEIDKLAEQANATQEEASKALVSAFDAGIRGLGRAGETVLQFPELVQQARQTLLTTTREMQQRGTVPSTEEQGRPLSWTKRIDDVNNPYSNKNYYAYTQKYLDSMVKIADNFDKIAQKQPEYIHFADCIDKTLFELS